jgi:hypothetical protein
MDYFSIMIIFYGDIIMSSCQTPFGTLIDNWSTATPNSNPISISGACNPTISTTDIGEPLAVRCPPNGEWIQTAGDTCLTSWTVPFQMQGGFSADVTGGFTLHANPIDPSVTGNGDVHNLHISKFSGLFPTETRNYAVNPAWGCTGYNPGGMPARGSASINFNPYISASLTPPEAFVSFDVKNNSAALNFDIEPYYSIPVPGTTPQCQRIAYNGDTKLCCAANLSAKTPYTTDGKVILSNGCPASDHSQPQCAYNTTCNPSYSWSTPQCDDSMAELCSVPVNYKSLIANDNWEQWSNDPSSICYQYVTSNLSSSSGVNKTISNTLRYLNGQFPLSYYTSWQNNKNAVTAWQNVLNAVNKAQSPASNQALSEVCSTFTRDQLSNMSSSVPGEALVLQACGCHLPDDQYMEFTGIIDEGSYHSCDPLCITGNAIKMFTSNNQPVLCKQTNCIIDDVVINMINSNQYGNIVFDQQCKGGASCYFSSQDDLEKTSSSVDVGKQCGKCYLITDPKNPVEVACGSNANIPWWKKFWDKYKDITIGAVILIVLIFIVFAILIVVRKRGETIALLGQMKSAYMGGR